HLHASRQGRGAGGARIGRLRSGGSARAPRGARAGVVVRRADHGEAARRGGARGRDAREGAADARLRRRTHVPRRPRPRHARAGPAPRADLRPGREPDDHHRALEAPSRRRRASTPSRAARIRGTSTGRGGSDVARRRGTGAPRRRGGRSVRARRRGDVGILAQSRGQRGGWLWTGDMGAFDADGFLTLKDRSKDLIVSGGSNIYPREVEEVLLTHERIAECAVVGRPDREWGERVVAFVVARGAPPPEPSELDRLCLEHIARFKRPREYRFVERLPKNNYGKVVKGELRSMLGADGGEALR